ncbi:SigE family RNA polymerase sigma factor [Kribbella sp. NPDC059898]|uniref:SigE family RNA polymerase sigma factor n=1 Tax=Kribbella sp. NPDC059898 TaxID=3346995 RepID=UPI003652307E
MEPEFEAFAVARQGALFRYAYLLVGDRGHAEDLLQEALTKTFMRWHRLRDSANAEAYTRRVITNTAFSWFRRKGWSEKPRDDVPPLPHTDDTTTRMWLRAEVRKLPPRQRAVLVLRYFEDLSLAETARILGCSEGTVKSQGNRALARLRATLGPEETLIIEEVVL